MEPEEIGEMEDCTLPTHPLIPADDSRYRVVSDPHSENDISNYVNSQAPDEMVHHIEKIREETLRGETYEIWDVTTDKDRWWVITNMTNLYSQQQFPSLDLVFSFHVGLMLRITSRPERVDADAPQPFDEVFRRGEQAQVRHDRAVEAVDYQAVGMQLRESLISLVGATRRRLTIAHASDIPQDSNFISWSEILMNELCGGGENKDLRKYLKNSAKETWQIVNWLTHDRNANRTASSVAIHACENIVLHFAQLLARARTDKADECPICKSRQIRTHFDIEIGVDGDYYASCGVCEWNSHPGATSSSGAAATSMSEAPGFRLSPE